ncbi:TRAP transporter large permease subunit, partial [Paenalcaligenes hominis]|uniref:TRAP transporter large permease subunit n=1 Tax=Paenalcaligenes hominis TaxID=643674 RepID=UPI00360D774F
SIAAGGTLGILIPPPSVIMVVYGILTETDIGKLFAAGFLPGFLAILMYLATVLILTTFNPKWANLVLKAHGRNVYMPQRASLLLPSCLW